MGGLLKACGCFDGPFSEEDPTFVSVRCDEHRDEPGEGVPMRRNAAGVAVMVQMARELARPGSMAIPKTRKRKRRRR